jgi:hypothetical protein
MAKMGKVSNASTPTKANIVFILLSPFLQHYHLENSVSPEDSKKGDNSAHSPDFRCASSEKEVSLFFDYNERFDTPNLLIPTQPLTPAV